MNIKDMMKKIPGNDAGGFYSAPIESTPTATEEPLTPALAVANDVVDKVEFLHSPSANETFSAEALGSTSLEDILTKANENKQELEEEKKMDLQNTNFSDTSSDNAGAPVSAPVSAPISAPVSEPFSATVSAPPEPVKEEPSLISRITRDTVINGSIISETDVDILGTIMGDIESKLFVSLTGKVYGNVSAQNAELNGAAVSGNIYVSEDLKLLGGSILVGDIYAQSTEIDGKIKGNISVSSKVKIKNGAYIIGDITSKNISVEPGAVVQGRISIESVAAEQDIESKFEELQKLALPTLRGAKPVIPPPARIPASYTGASATVHAESPVTAPVAAPVAAPIAAPVIAPVAAPAEAPVTAPVYAPVAAPISTPVTVSVSAPVSAHVAEEAEETSLESLLANVYSPSESSEQPAAVEAKKEEEVKDTASIVAEEDEAKQIKLRSALADLKKRSK